MYLPAALPRRTRRRRQHRAIEGLVATVAAGLARPSRYTTLQSPGPNTSPSRDPMTRGRVSENLLLLSGPLGSCSAIRRYPRESANLRQPLHQQHPTPTRTTHAQRTETATTIATVTTTGRLRHLPHHLWAYRHIKARLPRLLV